MSEETTHDAITQNGQTLKVKETELYVEEEFMGVASGIYLRVDLIYEDADGNKNVVFATSNGVGPEVDAPAERVTSAIGSKLSRNSYDSQMHD